MSTTKPQQNCLVCLHRYQNHYHISCNKGCFRKPCIRDVVFTNSARAFIFRSYMSLSIVHVFTTVGKKRKSVSWPVSSMFQESMKRFCVIEHLNYWTQLFHHNSICNQWIKWFWKTHSSCLSGSETKLWIVLLLKCDFDS